MSLSAFTITGISLNAWLAGALNRGLISSDDLTSASLL